jgi:hypothetical protein
MKALALLFIALPLLVLGTSEADTQCFQELNGAMTSFPEILKDLMKDKMSALTKHGKTLYQVGGKILGACKKADLRQYLNADTVNSQMDCITDFLGLIAAVEQIKIDVQSKNITKVIIDLSQMVPLLNKTYHDCFSAGNALKSLKFVNMHSDNKCQMARLSYTGMIALFHQMFKNQKESDILATSPRLRKSLVKMVETCHKSREEISYTLKNVGAVAYRVFGKYIAPPAVAPCLSKIGPVLVGVHAKLASTQQSDIEENQATIVAAMQSAVDTCEAVKNVEINPYLQKSNPRQSAKCLNDVLEMTRVLQSLKHQSNAKETAATVLELNKALETIAIDCEESFRVRATGKVLDKAEEKKCKFATISVANVLTHGPQLFGTEEYQAVVRLSIPVAEVITDKMNKCFI